MGFSRQEYWSWLPFPSPGNLPDSGIEPASPGLLHWQADSLPLSHLRSPYFSSVQSLSHVQLFATPWTAAFQASLSITNARSLLKFMSIELVMPSNHLILCCPLLLPSIFPSIRVFSNESVLCIRWPKYWHFSFSISPSNEYSGLISFRMDWLDIYYIHIFVIKENRNLKAGRLSSGTAGENYMKALCQVRLHNSKQTQKKSRLGSSYTMK